MKIIESEKTQKEVIENIMLRMVSMKENDNIKECIENGSLLSRINNGKFADQAKKYNVGTDDMKKMSAAILLMLAALKIEDPDDETIQEHKDLVLDLYENIDIFDAKIFEEDRFLKQIALPLYVSERFVFTHHSYEPNQLLLNGQHREYQCVDTLKVGFFVEKVNYPYVLKDGKYFASIEVNDLFNMKKGIAPLTKNVLITGLHLGYLAYYAQMKQSVTNITIVEEDQDAIDIFTQYILPQFVHPEKIHMIHSDVDTYMKNMDVQYDWILVDHYKNDHDMVYSYLEMKKYESRFKKTRFVYNREEAILYELKSLLTVSLSLSLAKESEKMLREVEENFEGTDKIKTVHSLFQDYTITSRSDVQKLFSNKQLKKIVKQNVNNI